MTPEEQRRTRCTFCGKVIYPSTPRITLSFCSQSDLDRYIENLKEEN